jgi:hypothetical protein
MKVLNDCLNVPTLPSPVKRPQANHPSPEPFRPPVAWKPDGPKMTREELRQIVMEVIG